MKEINVKIDLVQLYNDRVITDEMLIALLFGDGVGQSDGVTPEDLWKKKSPEPTGFISLLEAFEHAPLDEGLHDVFDAIEKWLNGFR